MELAVVKYKSFAGNNKNHVFEYLSVFQSHSLIK